MEATESAPDIANQEQRDNERTRHVQVRVHFHPEDFDKIEELRIAVNARTIPILIRDALALYRFWNEKRREGYRIQLTKPGEAPVEPILVFGGQ